MDIWVQIIGVDMTPEISFLLDGATTVVILYNHQVNNTINNNNNNNNISHVHCFAFHSFKGLARFPALSFGRAFFNFPPFSLAAHCFPRSCFDCTSCFFLFVNFVSQVWLASCFPISTSTMVSPRRLIIVFLYLFLTFSVASAARSPAFYCFSCVVAISFEWFAVYSFPRFFLAFKFACMLYSRACAF